MIFAVLILWSAYVFFSFPNKEKIEDSLKNRYSHSLTPNKSNYDSLVKIDKKVKRTILLGQAKSAVMYNRSFPFSNHKFDQIETERILKIINDSASFDWGEIGTPYYDKIIVFFDDAKKECGYLDVSLDGQIIVFPNIAVTKWGFLSDSGFKNLVIATRTE
jgi:hypothetical protein